MSLDYFTNAQLADSYEMNLKLIPTTASNILVASDLIRIRADFRFPLMVFAMCQILSLLVKV